MSAPKLSRKTVLVSSVAGAVAVVGGGVLIAEAASGPPQEPERDLLPDQDPDIGYAVEAVAAMSLEEKVAQLFMVYVAGESAEADDADSAASNRERLGAETPAAFVRDKGPGGIIYFDWANGLGEAGQVAELSRGLQEASAVPMLIATDQEYGTVVRVGAATQFPGAMPLGATDDLELAERAAAIAGGELRAMGLTQNFAPDADVNVDPANPVIGVRSFGSDPDRVAEFTAAQVEGYRSARIAVSAKHFPGHGDTGTDSHAGLPVITHSEEEWERVDLPPFAAAIEAGADMIMTGHLQFPALDDSGLPATLSEPILTGLLRERLGFEGVIITDSLEMQGVREQYGDDRVPVLALLAGADLLLMPPDFTLAYEAVLAAVASGELTEERIDASAGRLLALKYRLGLIGAEEPRADETGDVGSEDHLAVAADIAERSVTLLANDGTLPSGAANLLVTGWGENTTARLAEAFTSLGLQAEALVTGDEPDAAAITAAAAAAEGRDLVVVATHDVKDGSPQADLVAALVATGVPVACAAVGTPYDAAFLGEVGASLATYSYAAASLAALAKVVTGEVEPTGTLPVDVPDAAGAVAFPIGHGLRYP
ncbi:glycoside hydrolase family 3 protein [Glycomyces paridis]|uniref:beta-N-acetylhexosaminidase n=1 Tax=Glycomyces paridis TaxID=2126555 RepID=A0A4S8PN22_9ACTN|nr:glycoside hydrolase family 3 protein [Glycomyces paridis]THV31531.1 glycoside hydrolase family 3 protein [Glycomyces paridis]